MESPPPDESRANAINIVSWLGVALTVLFVGARVYTRAIIIRAAGWDDALLIVAVVLKVACVSVTSLAVIHGLGRHAIYLTSEQISSVLYHTAILQPIGITAFCLPKVSLVIFLKRLMGPTIRGLYFLYFLLVILFIRSSFCFIFLFAQCNPPNHFWHPNRPAKCMSPNVLENIGIFAGSWAAFTDLVLAAYPVAILWKLQIQLSHQIAACFIMGLGFIAMICTIVKSTQLPNLQSPDFTWESFSLLVTTFIETDVVIICACVPSLPKLVRRILGKDIPEPSDDKYSSNEAQSSSTNLADYRQFGIRQEEDHELRRISQEASEAHTKEKTWHKKSGSTIIQQMEVEVFHESPAA